jgi:hypothetical protein
MIAHRMEWLADQEIAMARAVPKVIPDRTNSTFLDDPFIHVSS